MATTDPRRPDQVFISYAHEDLGWRQAFERMFAPARERGIVDVWCDEAIGFGEDWCANIQKAVASTRVALLLVTPSFLESKFINDVEMAAFLRSAERGSIAIRWVPVSASLVTVTPLNALQACWDPDRPLDGLAPPEQQAAIQRICLEIVEEFGVMPTVSVGRRDSLLRRVRDRLDDKYELQEEIATGKFSMFYRAERINPSRTVGVKVFVASELDDWARQAFTSSVERAVELTSPAFIRILDHYMDESPECLVTEYVDGEPLSRLLKRYPNGMPLYRVKSVMMDLVCAVEDAHRHNWLRGELCPSDVLIARTGAARLSPVDFSNVLREQAHLTGNFLVDRESLAYMSPERYYGRPRTQLTDQYSLGLIARELLGGPQVPRVVCPADLQVKPQLFADLESGSGGWADRSPELAGIISRMLRADPGSRWPSMRDVRHFLREVEVAESPEERYRRVAKSSYLRLQSRGLEGQRTFFARFYERLFASCPELQRHFETVDMDRQYQILNGAIHVLLDCRPTSTSGSQALRELAANHARFGLTEQHYHIFIEALVATIGELVDQEPDHLAAWRATLQPAVDAMARADVGGQIQT